MLKDDQRVVALDMADQCKDLADLVALLGRQVNGLRIALVGRTAEPPQRQLMVDIPGYVDDVFEPVQWVAPALNIGTGVLQQRVSSLLRTSQRRKPSVCFLGAELVEPLPVPVCSSLEPAMLSPNQFVIGLHSIRLAVRVGDEPLHDAADQRVVAPACGAEGCRVGAALDIAPPSRKTASQHVVDYGRGELEPLVE